MFLKKKPECYASWQDHRIAVFYFNVLYAYK